MKPTPSGRFSAVTAPHLGSPLVVPPVPSVPSFLRGFAADGALHPALGGSLAGCAERRTSATSLVGDHQHVLS